MKFKILLLVIVFIGQNLYSNEPSSSLNSKLEAKFDEYKVKEVYKDEIKIPNSYKKDEEGLYRDKFGKFVSNQQDFYVNFAGKYMIVTHSCGTSCYYRTVEDLSAGKTVKVDGMSKFDNTETRPLFKDSEMGGFAKLYTREDSTLMLVQYLENETDICKQEYFVLKTLKNSKMKLKSISKRTPCDTPIK